MFTIGVVVADHSDVVPLQSSLLLNRVRFLATAPITAGLLGEAAASLLTRSNEVQSERESWVGQYVFFFPDPSRQKRGNIGNKNPRRGGFPSPTALECHLTRLSPVAGEKLPLGLVSQLPSNSRSDQSGEWAMPERRGHIISFNLPR